jgi:hypothetical protein
VAELDERAYGGCGDPDESEPVLIDFPVDHQGDYAALAPDPPLPPPPPVVPDAPIPPPLAGPAAPDGAAPTDDAVTGDGGVAAVAAVAAPAAAAVAAVDGETQAGDVTEASGAPFPIAGLSVLKGLLLYGATLVFAGFYAYFMAKIASAPEGRPPSFDPAMISVAAALAGVLGSAFALAIGVPTREQTVNRGLQSDLDALDAPEPEKRLSGGARVLARIRQALSLEPGRRTAASIPITVGIWVYAAVGSAVAVTYFLNQQETPDAVKALAVAFAGYVLALVTAAYGLATRES